jgi:hypothetical protein
MQNIRILKVSWKGPLRQLQLFICLRPPSVQNFFLGVVKYRNFVESEPGRIQSVESFNIQHSPQQHNLTPPPPSLPHTMYNTHEELPRLKILPPSLPTSGLPGCGCRVQGPSGCPLRFLDWTCSLHDSIGVDHILCSSRNLENKIKK